MVSMPCLGGAGQQSTTLSDRAGLILFVSLFKLMLTSSSCLRQVAYGIDALWQNWADTLGLVCMPDTGRITNRCETHDNPSSNSSISPHSLNHDQTPTTL